MGCLYERRCSHCVNLCEALSSGLCEITGHRIEKTGDDEKAKTCEYYKNKYGYGGDQDEESK